MSEHLSPEQIEWLGAYQLKGTALLAALRHIEECEECRAQIKSPTVAEVLDQLFRDESQIKSFETTKSLENGFAHKSSTRTGWLVWFSKIFHGKSCY